MWRSWTHGTISRNTGRHHSPLLFSKNVAAPTVAYVRTRVIFPLLQSQEATISVAVEGPLVLCSGHGQAGDNSLILGGVSDECQVVDGRGELRVRSLISIGLSISSIYGCITDWLRTVHRKADRNGGVVELKGNLYINTLTHRNFILGNCPVTEKKGMLYETSCRRFSLLIPGKMVKPTIYFVRKVSFQARSLFSRQ